MMMMFGPLGSYSLGQEGKWIEVFRARCFEVVVASKLWSRLFFAVDRSKEAVIRPSEDSSQGKGSRAKALFQGLWGSWIKGVDS